MSKMAWVSPDAKISKYIIGEGEWGCKPTENCFCSIIIADCSSTSIQKYSDLSDVTIGDSCDSFERILHSCLLTMYKSEQSKFTFKLEDEGEVSFTLTLVNFTSNGLIYEWDARKKCDLVLKHKMRGNDLFNQLRYNDASHCFGKALKILSSIPIKVDDPPNSIDEINIQEIYNLKSSIYNNLASCYLKCGKYNYVITLCQKVLARDNDNIKALYKQGVAKCETEDYDGAYENLTKIISIEPDNKAALERLKFVKNKLALKNVEYNVIIKRMFSNFSN